jgi:hypothetical protein
LLLQAKSRPFERERRYGDLSNLRRSPVEVGLISGDGINLECSRLILLPFSAQSSIEITPDTDDMATTGDEKLVCLVAAAVRQNFIL